MPDPHAPSPDALDAALIALDTIESHHLDQNARKGRDPSRSTTLKLLAEARAAVRRLAEQGEVAEVIEGKMGDVSLAMVFTLSPWPVGTKVRVTRIEEAP